jgi:hypothetical protein
MSLPSTDADVDKMLEDEYEETGLPGQKLPMVDKETETDATAAGAGIVTTSTGTNTRSSGGSAAGASTSGGGGASLPKIYRSIRAAKLSSMTVRPLGGGAVTQFHGIGSFSDDPRFGTNNNRFSYDAKFNVSSSFSLKDVMCNTCPSKGPHTVLYREGGGGHVRTEQSPRCFVLTDQNFPPAVPASGEGECLKTLLIEDAKLMELGDAFLEFSKGFEIPAGSVVLLFSASHLAWSGTAAYARDWLAVRGKILRVLGGGVEILMGFPLLQTGTADGSFIRSLLEIELWHEQLGISKGRDICKTRKNLYSHYYPKTEPVVVPTPGAGTPLAPVKTGTPLAPGSDPLILKMPINIDGQEEGSFLSPGYNKFPVSLEPLEAEDEVNILLDLIRELNSNFVMDLDEDIEMVDKNTQEVGVESAEQQHKCFLVVGNSHASRLVCALEDLGHEAKLISTSGWADNSDVSNSIAQLIKEEVELNGSDLVVIYMLYDNEVYIVEHEDGELTSPIKIGGRFHINGKLAVVDRDRFKEIFNLSVPLLRAGGECPKLLISPLLRYITSPCCKEANHLTNYGGPEYALLLGEAVDNMKTWLKDFTYGKKIRNFKVICSNTSIGFDEEEEVEKKRKLKEFWSSDPVHLSAPGYTKLASDIVKKGESGLVRATSSLSEKRPGQPASKPPPKRARWVEDDEATAPRNQRGHGRGHGRGRGFFGGRGRWQKWRGRAGHQGSHRGNRY